MISIIIINYRQKNFLNECIKSIFENLHSQPFEVIIVNNSPEEKLDELQRRHSGIKIIENHNKGYSHANNLAAKQASGAYLFFLNADTEIKSDFLKSFMDEFREKNFGAAGLKLMNEDGSFQLSFWKDVSFYNEKINKSAEIRFKEKDNGYISAIEKEYSETKSVDWVTGAAMIVRKDRFMEIGGFDENFFLFYEDADLCKRMNESGYKNYFFPFAEIIHHKGENVNREFASGTYYYAKESQLLYYAKHCTTGDKLMLRTYLFIKFLFLYAATFKKINRDIFLLTLGKKRNDKHT